MDKMIAIMKKEHTYIPSEIDGLSDLLWSMGARNVYTDSDKLIKWFYTKVPAFDNRVPMDILLKDGEEVLFKYMLTLPC